jgi:uncharacterized membrane protein YdjX (TVP38/TMEM64 family)
MKRYKKSLFLLVLAVIAVAAYFLGLKSFLTLTYLKQVSMKMHQSVAEHYWLVVFKYILAYSLFVATAMPGVLLLTLLGGYLFGTIGGTLYSVIGALCGSLLFFTLIRYLLVDYVKSWKSVRIEKMCQHVKEDGASYLLLLQFLTLVPYFVINTVAALAHVPLITFMWTTVVGAFPLLFVYAFAGRRLSTIQSLSDVLSPGVLIMFLLLALMALVPVALKRMKRETLDW